MSDWTQFTAVFEYDIRKYDGNPFHADTPFGRPTLTAVGNLAEQIEVKDEEIERLLSENARLKNIIQRRLDCDGSNGIWDAKLHYDLTEEMRAAPASAPCQIEEAQRADTASPVAQHLPDTKITGTQ